MEVWNHFYRSDFADTELASPRHSRIDLVARDSQERLLLVEHGELPTFDGCREAEHFLREFVAPSLQRAFADLMGGKYTVVRVLTRGGRVPRDIASRLVVAVRRDLTLRVPGRHVVEDVTGILAEVRIDLRAGPVVVGPMVDATLDVTIAYLRRRLHQLIDETAAKHAAVRATLPTAAAHVPVLLVEADDFMCLSDSIYSTLFDSAAEAARQAGLSAMWRVAADCTDVVDFWQEWDADCPVPARRRPFRWVERDGSIHEG